VLITNVSYKCCPGRLARVEREKEQELGRLRRTKLREEICLEGLRRQQVRRIGAPWTNSENWLRADTSLRIFELTHC
jgi:hypothetical protein